jgi:hypothetical protein
LCDQATKTNKFKCKLCGEKQSVKTIFLSSEQAKDCRALVQQMNMARANMDTHAVHEDGTMDYEEPDVATQGKENASAGNRSSKWSAFLPASDM